MSRIAIPATVLQNRVMAKWVRQYDIEIDVRSGGDLAVAQAARVHPGRLIVHADELSEAELRTALNLGPGHIVVGSMQQITALRSMATHLTQDVVLRMGDISAAAKALHDHPLLELTGIHCEIGSRDGAFISFPAAIGVVIAAMSTIRDQHGVTVTRLSFDDRSNSTADLSLRTAQIDAAVAEACLIHAFPTPAVIVATRIRLGGQSAA